MKLPFAVLCFTAILLGVSNSVAAPLPPTGGDVKLDDKGAQVLLSNGIVSALVNKSGANIASLVFHDTEMVRPGGGNIYFSMDGGKDFRSPSRCVFSVKTQTPDAVDVVCKRIWKDEPQAFDIDIHFVLRRGQAGVYVYAVLDHPTNYPATGYGEWRMVWKIPSDLFDHICVDDLRHWPMPASADYKTAQATPIKEIVKITQGVRAGAYDCKYDFNASYYDLGCWGHAGAASKLGAWIVCGGYDFFNDGPTKQDLNAAAGINHIHFGMNHYGGSTVKVAAGEKWTKMYGPYLVYCNYDEGGVDALWQDARKRVAQEKAAWPYAWVAGEPQYPPAAARGSVSGRLVVRDALKPQLTGAGAWVGVAQPDPGGNWQFESKHYQYWVRADADGLFTIPNVRPGDYTPYAFTTGAVDEFAGKPLRVAAGQTVQLGDVGWAVPHAGTSLAWEIGVPDRTAKEFRHGNDYFHGYVWQNFAREFTNPLEYTVGKSNPATDWNFAQSAYGEGNKLVPWKWRIHFRLTQDARGDGTLVLAFAGADRARVEVYANDETRPVSTVSPAVQGGNALLRESVHAKYCSSRVVIPADRLHAGDNVISLVQTSTRGPGLHVMYDYVCLELP
jgi:rhamnogalacturonan endolyase